MTSTELARVQRLRGSIVTGDSSAEDVETILRARDVRVSVAGRGGKWIVFLTWPGGHETRDMADTWYEALAGAIGKRVDECKQCGGDGYYKGPRLGDEPCPACGGSGRDGGSSAPCPECLERSGR